MKQDNNIKNLVLSVGDKFIEGITWFLLCLVGIVSLFIINTDEILGLLFLIVGVMVVLISSWLIFCIIDIRDLLREIVTNTSEYKNNEESESKDNTIVNEESNNEELKFKDDGINNEILSDDDVQKLPKLWKNYRE